MHLDKKDFISIGCLFVIVLLFLNQLLFTDNLVGSGDMFLQVYPFNTATLDILKTHQFPLWINYIYSGMPFFLSQMYPFIYPSDFILSVLKIPINNYDFILHIFLAGFFMFLFMREIVKDKIACLFSSVGFMFSCHLFTIIYAGHIFNIKAMIWMPLLMFFISRGVNRNKIVYFILGGAAFGIQMLTGSMQYIFYIMIALTLYFAYKLFWIWKESRNYKIISKFIIYFLIFIIIGIGLSAVQVFPFYEYSKWCQRANADYDFVTSFSEPPEEFLTFLLPQYLGLKAETYWGRIGWVQQRFPIQSSDYVGILPLFLAILAFWFNRNKKEVWFFIGLAVFAVILALGRFTPLYSLISFLPGFNSFRTPKRILLLFAFSTFVLSGFFLDYILNGAKEKIQDFTENVKKKIKKEKINAANVKGNAKIKQRVIIIAVLFLIVALIAIGSLDQMVEFFKDKNLGRMPDPGLIHSMANESLFLMLIITVCSAVIIFLLINKKYSHFAKYLAVILLLFDLYMINSKFISMSNPAYLHNKSDSMKFIEQDKSLYRVFAVDWKSGMMSNNFAIYKMQSITGYMGLPLAHYSELMEKVGFNNLSVLSMLNVKYLLSDNPINHPSFKLAYDSQIKVYEYLNPLPRAFAVNNIKIIKDKDTIINELRSPNFNPKTYAILEEDCTFLSQNSDLKGTSIQVAKYTPNEIHVTADMANNGLLVLSEIYYPGWKALVDGKESKVYKADYVLRSVYLEKGKHEIKFIFDPFSFKIGLYISIITAAVLCIYGLIYLILGKFHKNNG